MVRPKLKPGKVICSVSGFVVTPQKPNLSPKRIEQFREQLRTERAHLLEQADELRAEADQLAAERDQGDTQFDEESGEGDTLSVERERDLFLSAANRQIVEEIDRAMERIENGTYGVCVPARKRLPIARLEALPWVETCVDCKTRAERRR
ncbi:MAG: hypothetical protein R3A49_03740 [Acidimicrobiia bacterium]